jgi:AraC-like DNA-binding protein
LIEISHTSRRSKGASIAAATRYSPSRLRALSRSALGEAPAARLRRRSLDSAACALLRGGASLRRIARDAGFSSTEAFHRAFRARFGCTPRTWAQAGPPPGAPRALAIGAGIARLFGHHGKSRHG